jgi:hypothetical protein
VADAVTAAVIAGGVSLLVSGASALASRRLQDARMHAEAKNARLGQQAALDQQASRLRTELRTEFMAEEAIHALLTHEDWTLRSLDAIKRRVKGFDDEELRRLLVRAGAVAFDRPDSSEEMWGFERTTSIGSSVFAGRCRSGIPYRG